MGPLCFGFAFTLLGGISLRVVTQGMCQANLPCAACIKFNTDGLVQERRNSSVLAMEFRFCCTNPSMWYREIVMTLSDLQGSCWALQTVTVPGHSLNQEIWPGPWFNINKNISYQYRKSHYGEIEQSEDRLTSTMGFPILMCMDKKPGDFQRCHFHKMATWWPYWMNN